MVTYFKRPLRSNAPCPVIYRTDSCSGDIGHSGKYGLGNSPWGSKVICWLKVFYTKKCDIHLCRQSRATRHKLSNFIHVYIKIQIINVKVYSVISITTKENVRSEKVYVDCLLTLSFCNVVTFPLR